MKIASIILLSENTLKLQHIYMCAYFLLKHSISPPPNALLAFPLPYAFDRKISQNSNCQACQFWA